MIARLLLAGCSIGALAAAPAATPAGTSKPAPVPAAGAAPSFEAVISEAVIASMLTAMMPYDAVMEQEVGALGFTKVVQVNVRLTDPKVKVAKDGIKVTVNYALSSPSGMFNQAGTAYPQMTLTPVPSKQMIEGRLVKSGVTLPGGMELPIEDLVDPIEIPSVLPQEVELGEKNVIAEARMNEVLLEDGKIRVKGDVVFKPAAVAAPASAPPK